MAVEAKALISREREVLVHSCGNRLSFQNGPSSFELLQLVVSRGRVLLTSTRRLHKIFANESQDEINRREDPVMWFVGIIGPLESSLSLNTLKVSLSIGCCWLFTVTLYAPSFQWRHSSVHTLPQNTSLISRSSQTAPSKGLLNKLGSVHYY